MTKIEQIPILSHFLPTGGNDAVQQLRGWSAEGDDELNYLPQLQATSVATDTTI